MRFPPLLAHYGFAAALIAGITFAGWVLRARVGEADLAMLLLLGVVIVALRRPLGPSLMSAVLSVAAFDFFFVPPFYTFEIRQPNQVVTFVALAVVGGVISSLTVRLRERERVANETKLLVEAERIRNALLSSVSHDLRTPLGSILGAASAMQDPHLDDAARHELMRTLCEETRHLQRSLDNLLQMTRVAEASLEIFEDWNVPEEIVGSVLQRLGSLLDTVELTIDIHPDVTLASFDGFLIELVLVNLLENSVKYGPPNGRIHLMVQHDGEDLRWEVTDEGPGIRPGDESRIFEKFQRGAPTGKRGTGLGLTIAKAVVDAHGGRIWGHTRDDGRGAVFGFTLPQNGEAPTLPQEELA